MSTKPLTGSELGDLAQRLRTTTGLLARALREHGGRLGLTPSQAEALGYVLREGPMSVTALASLVGVRSQSMGATVAVLEESELVTVTPDVSDRRQKVIAATARATEAVSASRALREDWLAQRIRTTFSAAEQRDLQRAVELLAHVVDD